MKTRIYLLLILASIFAMSSFQAEAQFKKDIKARIAAGEPLYVVFTNFDQPMNAITVGGVPATQVMYYQPLEATVEYGEYTIKANFDDNFLTTYDLADFSAAVFPLGDYPLHAQTPGGITVLSQVQKMLAAGKRVIILGRGYMYHALNPASQNKNQQAADFLNSCGINYLARLNLINGQQYIPFSVKGVADNDTISKGYVVACNVNKGRNGQGPLPPWKPAESIDAFKIRDTAIAKPAHFFTYHHTLDDQYVNSMKPTDTIVSCRVYTPNSKMVLYSMGFEPACPAGWLQDFWYSLWGSFNWFMYDMPRPNPWLTFSVDPLEFDSVEVGTSSIKEVTIQNFGKKTMQISDIYVDNFNGDDVFELLTTNTTMQLAPLAKAKLQVRFKPKTTRRYEDYLTVLSNADNGKTLSIDLVGYGGGKPKEGPRMSLSTTLLDFGDVPIAKWDTLSLGVSNIGTALLIVDRIDWVDSQKGAFQFYNNMSFPLSIDPGKTVNVLFKFIPTQQGKQYRGKILARTGTQSVTADTIYVTLLGNCPAGEASTISVSESIINFDTVPVNADLSKQLTLTNTGNALIEIDTFQIENDVDGVFKITSALDFPIPIYKMDPVWTADIKYTPKVKDKLSTAKLHVTCNAANKKDFYVDLQGFAGAPIGVDDQQEEGFIVTVNPVPVSDIASIMFDLKGNTSMKVDMFLVDVLGNKIVDVLNQQITPGLISTQLNVIGLSSGMYYLVTNAGSRSTKTPIVVTK